MKTQKFGTFRDPLPNFCQIFGADDYTCLRPLFFFTTFPPLARPLLFWVHSGALWCTGALFQTFAKFPGPRRVKSPRNPGGTAAPFSVIQVLLPEATFSFRRQSLSWLSLVPLMAIHVDCPNAPFLLWFERYLNSPHSSMGRTSRMACRGLPRIKSLLRNTPISSYSQASKTTLNTIVYYER